MIKSLRHFEAILGYNVKEIDKVLADIGKFYNTFSKPKRSGKKRIFDSSEAILRDLQNRINDRIFGKIKLPYFITGSIKERSAVLNAKYHSGKKYHFQTDFVGYFEFVSNKQVYNTLVTLGFSADVASYLTKLTTYKGHLPQGVPTSPFLCNIVGLMLVDFEFIEFCSDKGITYTRYIDDLTFSSDSNFKEHVPHLLEIIASSNLLYSHRKTLHKIGDIVVTGVLTTCNGLKEPEHLVMKLEQEVDPDKKKGLENYAAQIKRINKSFPLKKFIENNLNLSHPEKILVEHRKKD